MNETRDEFGCAVALLMSLALWLAFGVGFALAWVLT